MTDFNFHLQNFQDPTLDADYVSHLVGVQARENETFHRQLWNYYRNPMLPVIGSASGAMNEHSKPYFLAQEVGLPARITGVQRTQTSEHLTDLRRKEVVIENDIGWRINTMVDFLFGQPISLRSKARDEKTACAIEAILTNLLDANGGSLLLQEMALFASVFGFVDLALRIPADWPAKGGSRLAATAGAPAESIGLPTPNSAGQPGSPLPTDCHGQAVELARTLRLEPVEASRVLPILGEDDYRQIRYWIQRYDKHPARLASARRPWLRLPGRASSSPGPDSCEVVEILARHWWQRYEGGRLVAQGPNALGELPIVHIQNVASPGAYVGVSDVESLIPLQDELNTRLSDRAHRVTYQSFKMYLGKGIDDFLERPVGPGQMWASQNLQASIEEFGSDEGSPSEDIHIAEIRSAIDKTSGVTPVAAGLIEGKVGNLSSAAALRITLAGLVSRTTRKRLTFTEGLQNVARLVLAWLDRTGVFPTDPEDRHIDVHWPSILPADEGEQLRTAHMKKILGVPEDRVLAELGYDRDVTPLADPTN